MRASSSKPAIVILGSLKSKVIAMRIAQTMGALSVTHTSTPVECGLVFEFCAGELPSPARRAHTRQFRPPGPCEIVTPAFEAPRPQRSSRRASKRMI